MTRIPDKLHFKIGEVASIAGVKPHVLRYWETEFALLRPQKSRSNQRLYRRRDVELVLEIKRLLYDEGFTIPGARRRLREMARGEADASIARGQALAVIAGVRSEMEGILALIAEDEARDPAD